MGSVANQQRRELRTRMVADAKDLIRIVTRKEALQYGDDWQRAYHSLEATHTLVCAQLEASELLLRLATEELQRLKALTV